MHMSLTFKIHTDISMSKHIRKAIARTGLSLYAKNILNYK